METTEIVKPTKLRSSYGKMTWKNENLTANQSTNRQTYKLTQSRSKGSNFSKRSTGRFSITIFFLMYVLTAQSSREEIFVAINLLFNDFSFRSYSSPVFWLVVVVVVVGAAAAVVVVVSKLAFSAQSTPRNLPGLIGEVVVGLVVVLAAAAAAAAAVVVVVVVVVVSVIITIYNHA